MGDKGKPSSNIRRDITQEKFDEFSLSAMQGPINALRERLWVQMEQRMDPAGRLGGELAWECGTEQRDPALTLVGKWKGSSFGF